MTTFVVVLFLQGVQVAHIGHFYDYGTCDSMKSVIEKDINDGFDTYRFGIAVENGAITRRSDWEVECNQAEKVLKDTR